MWTPCAACASRRLPRRRRPPCQPRRRSQPIRPGFSRTPSCRFRFCSAPPPICSLASGTVHWGGADYTSAAGHIVLQDGVLRIDPGLCAIARGPCRFLGQRGQQRANAGRRAEPALRRCGAQSADPGARLARWIRRHGRAGCDTAWCWANTARACGLAGPAMPGWRWWTQMWRTPCSALAAGDLLRSTGAKLDPNGRSHVRLPGDPGGCEGWPGHAIHAEA